VDTVDLETNRKVIGQTVISVMDTLLGLSVEPCEVPWQVMPDRVTAAIQFSGSTCGSLVVEVDASLARKFAGGLLAIDPPDAIDNDVRDAVGEIANVIGGNLNTSFAWGAILSFPYVVDGSDFKIRVCGKCIIIRQAFVYENELFWVSWIAKSAEESQ